MYFCYHLLIITKYIIYLLLLTLWLLLMQQQSMFDLVFITFFVLLFSFLHSKDNNRKFADKFFIFVITEIAIIYSYVQIIKG